MAARWRADLGRDGVDPAVIERRIAISHARITGAAALIVPSVSMEEMDSYPDAIRAEAEWLMAVQSVALASAKFAAGRASLRLGRVLDVRTALCPGTGAHRPRLVGCLAASSAHYVRLSCRNEAKGARANRHARRLALISLYQNQLAIAVRYTRRHPSQISRVHCKVSIDHL